MELEGKVAIVTGSSRGIGKGIALAYAQEGASVVVTARTVAPGQSRVSGTIHQTVEEINALGAGRAMAVQCDVTKEDQVEALVHKTLEEYGRIDILVNNAGGSFALSTIQDIPIHRWDGVIDLNLRGVFLGCKLVMSTMIQQKGGSIINVSSGAAAGTPRTMAAYATSKAAVERFTLCLAEELREHDIAVNAYRPGSVRTEGADYVYGPNFDYSRMDPPSAVGPSLVWMARQTATTFTGRVVSRGEFGRSWGPGAV